MPKNHKLLSDKVPQSLKSNAFCLLTCREEGITQAGQVTSDYDVLKEQEPEWSQAFFQIAPCLLELNRTRRGTPLSELTHASAYLLV